jgi:hypothetical protein
VRGQYVRPDERKRALMNVCAVVFDEVANGTDFELILKIAVKRMKDVGHAIDEVMIRRYYKLNYEEVNDKSK